ncbi:hypothetical protein UA08_06398 [Talaromyces atroroseus]|uniref:Major facilitator superfamily (MFS) profile domain-containing protein n=1 Tax=Talaromyces atroroseus TaxID=1441469 RepID=A0A225AI90_TALAT|nr:hypothetical protein UA08_06398 [Talaromyces atroroseus]OKL57944.1 hypothetical protein UA08_06398 [Talaromyces atroroseus]
MHFFSGARGPLQLYKSSKATNALLILASCIFATTTGYDSALINGINIIPSYTATLKLTVATKSLNTASAFLGWAIVSTFMGPVVDRVGRRTGVLISICFKFIGTALMTGAQGVAMFVVGRMILGAGAGTSPIAASTYFLLWLSYAGVKWLAETLPKHTRASGLSFIYSVFYVGSLIAAGVTYRTAEIPGSWSWRVPCLLQAPFSIFCLIILFFVPESPRCSRKRLLLVVSVAVLAMSSGNNLVTFYLGDILDNAGITNSTTQLKICLVVACLGTWLVDRAGRKRMCLVSVAAMTIFIFLVGAFTKLYGSGGNNSGIYGNVAMIFLFQASYAIGITPLTLLYPPEVLNFSIRSNGMAAWTFAVTCGGIFSVFVWPFALNALGWKTYMIYGAWDVVQFCFVAIFWIETKGLSLEEIDRKFEKLDSAQATHLEGLEVEGKVIVDDTKDKLEFESR